MRVALVLKAELLGYISSSGGNFVHGMTGTLVHEKTEGGWWEDWGQRWWVGCGGRTLALEMSKAAGLEQWFALVSTGVSVFYHNPRGLKQHNFILLCIISVTWVPDPRGKVLTDPSSFLETLKTTLFPWCIGQFLFFLLQFCSFPAHKHPEATSSENINWSFMLAQGCPGSPLPSRKTQNP